MARPKSPRVCAKLFRQLADGAGRYVAMSRASMIFCWFRRLFSSIQTRFFKERLACRRPDIWRHDVASVCRLLAGQPRCDPRLAGDGCPDAAAVFERGRGCWGCCFHSPSCALNAIEIAPSFCIRRGRVVGDYKYRLPCAAAFMMSFRTSQLSARHWFKADDLWTQCAACALKPSGRLKRRDAHNSRCRRAVAPRKIALFDANVASSEMPPSASMSPQHRHQHGGVTLDIVALYTPLGAFGRA